MGLGTELDIIADDLATPRAVKAVAECDVVFGCMDGVEGRHLLNRLAAYYVLPYFDVGIKLEADGRGGVNEACGAVHYVRPDGATLLDRKLYTIEQLKAAGLRRSDPKAYRAQVKAGYIRGVVEDRPAVISINMQMASAAVNEFLARLHPYRYDDNANSSVVRTSFISSAPILGSARVRRPAASLRILAKATFARCCRCPNLASWRQLHEHDPHIRSRIVGGRQRCLAATRSALAAAQTETLLWRPGRRVSREACSREVLSRR